MYKQMAVLVRTCRLGKTGFKERTHMLAVHTKLSSQVSGREERQLLGSGQSLPLGISSVS